MPNNYPQPALYIQSGSPLTENRPQDSYSAAEVGSQQVVIDPTDDAGAQAKRFQMVILDSAMSVAPTAGAVAYWRNRTGYVVTTSVSIGGRGNVAGVFVCAIDVDNVGFIQQGGPCDVQAQTSPTSAPDDTGKIVIPSATDAKADVLGAGSAATYPPLGVSISSATAGVFRAQLNIPSRP